MNPLRRALVAVAFVAGAANAQGEASTAPDWRIVTGDVLAHARTVLDAAAGDEGLSRCDAVAVATRIFRSPFEPDAWRVGLEAAALAWPQRVTAAGNSEVLALPWLLLDGSADPERVRRFLAAQRVTVVLEYASADAARVALAFVAARLGTGTGTDDVDAEFDAVEFWRRAGIPVVDDAADLATICRFRARIAGRGVVLALGDEFPLDRSPEPTADLVLAFSHGEARRELRRDGTTLRAVERRRGEEWTQEFAVLDWTLDAADLVAPDMLTMATALLPLPLGQLAGGVVTIRVEGEADAPRFLLDGDALDGEAALFAALLRAHARPEAWVRSGPYRLGPRLVVEGVDPHGPRGEHLAKLSQVAGFAWHRPPRPGPTVHVRRDPPRVSRPTLRVAWGELFDPWLARLDDDAQRAAIERSELGALAARMLGGPIDVAAWRERLRDARDSLPEAGSFVIERGVCTASRLRLRSPEAAAERAAGFDASADITIDDREVTMRSGAVGFTGEFPGPDELRIEYGLGDLRWVIELRGTSLRIEESGAEASRSADLLAPGLFAAFPPAWFRRAGVRGPMPAAAFFLDAETPRGTSPGGIPSYAIECFRDGTRDAPISWRLGDEVFTDARTLLAALIRRQAQPSEWSQIDGAAVGPGARLRPLHGVTYGDVADTIDLLRLAGLRPIDLVRK